MLPGLAPHDGADPGRQTGASGGPRRRSGSGLLLPAGQAREYQRGKPGRARPEASAGPWDGGTVRAIGQAGPAGRTRAGRAGTRRRLGKIAWLYIAAVILMVSGITIALVGRDTLRWSPPPAPPSWAARAGPAPAAPAGPSGRRPAPLLRSTPVGIEIPAIRVLARTIPLGLSPDGTVAVPPLTTPLVTSWYDDGPAPGERGAAAIFGHVDAARTGPAVFYRLGTMRPGDLIFVQLRDGQTAVFQAYSVALYPKTSFPTAQVYRYTRWPTLRLVTCGGTFDRRTGHYLANVVVFASYVGRHVTPAS